MRYGLILPVLVVAALRAQTPTASIQASSAAPKAHATADSVAAPSSIVTAPVLGFVADKDGSGVIAVSGFASAPSLGETLPKPAGVSRLFLAPRQHFALVEQEHSGALAVWHLGRRHVKNGTDLLDALSGAMPHPDMVVFSPKGTAVALYSGLGHLQIVGGLPGQATIRADVAAVFSGPVTSLAVSDDARLVITASSDGEMHASLDGQAPQLMPWSYTPRTMAFVANSHNLVISDSRQEQLVVIPEGIASSVPSVVANGLQADALASSSDGSKIMCLDATSGTLTEIDATSLNASTVSLEQQPQTLVLLRDGHTFLVSLSPLQLHRYSHAPAAESLRIDAASAVHPNH